MEAVNDTECFCQRKHGMLYHATDTINVSIISAMHMVNITWHHVCTDRCKPLQVYESFSPNR